MPPKKAPNESLKTPNGKDRRKLTLNQKIEVFTYFKEVKCSARKLAKVFNIGKTQAGDIIKKGETLLQLFPFDGSYNITGKLRPGSAGFEIDRIMYNWYKEMKRLNIAITGPMIQNKALDLAKEMGHSEFKASNGWLLRFLKRHKIGLKPQTQNDDPVKDSDEELKQNIDEMSDVEFSHCRMWEKSLAVLLPKYSASDIYSAIHTGLFYKAIPSDISRLNGETCSCGKLSIERCTILFGVNMLGVKENPLVIVNMPKKEIKKVNKSEIDCVSDEKAWITKNIMIKWLREIDKKLGKENRNILLFLNYATPRPECQFKNIQIVNFPAFFSSENHPLNQGVIQNFKIIYRQKLLKHLIQLKENDENNTLTNQSISEPQAIEWISSAWKELSECVIQKGFEDLGFNPFVQNASLNSAGNEASASLNDVSDLLCALDSDVSAVDYVSFDNELVTWDNIENVEVLVDGDDLKHFYTDSEEEIETESHQKELSVKMEFEAQENELTTKSYAEALENLKHLKEFYLSRSDTNCVALVDQLLNETIISSVKVENESV